MIIDSALHRPSRGCTSMAMQMLRTRSAPLMRTAQQIRCSTGATFPPGAPPPVATPPAPPHALPRGEGGTGVMCRCKRVP
jgi:hypothetical protein